jgi:hypothetical protein
MPPPPPPAPAPGGSVTPGKSPQVAALEQLRHFVTGRDPIVASVPALIISLPRIDRPEVTGDRPTVMSVRLGQSVVIAELDGAYLTNSVLPTLAERYFPERDADTYRFAVVDSTDRGRCAPGVAEGSAIDPSHADATMPLFASAWSHPGRHADVAGAVDRHVFSAGGDAQQWRRPTLSARVIDSSSHAARPRTTSSSSRNQRPGSCAATHGGIAAVSVPPHCG